MLKSLYLPITFIIKQSLSTALPCPVPAMLTPSGLLFHSLHTPSLSSSVWLASRQSDLSSSLARSSVMASQHSHSATASSLSILILHIPGSATRYSPCSSVFFCVFSLAFLSLTQVEVTLEHSTGLSCSLLYPEWESPSCHKSHALHRPWGGVHTHRDVRSPS